MVQNTIALAKQKQDRVLHPLSGGLFAGFPGMAVSAEQVASLPQSLLQRANSTAQSLADSLEKRSREESKVRPAPAKNQSVAATFKETAPTKPTGIPAKVTAGKANATISVSQNATSLVELERKKKKEAGWKEDWAKAAKDSASLPAEAQEKAKQLTLENIHKGDQSQKEAEPAAPKPVEQKEGKEVRETKEAKVDLYKYEQKPEAKPAETKEAPKEVAPKKEESKPVEVKPAPAAKEEKQQKDEKKEVVAKAEEKKPEQKQENRQETKPASS